MTRHGTSVALATALIVTLGTPAPAPAQDLGKLLERAARDKLREALDPQRIGRSVVPGRPAVPGQGGQPPVGSPYGGAQVPVPRQGVAPAIAPTGGPFAAPAPATSPRGEVVPIKTADGWTIVAHHYRPTAPAVPGAPPVILCHGLTYSALFWDLDPSCSLPEYLASQGFDVWSVSLRGSGLSQKWVWSPEDAPEALLGQAIRRATRGKFGSQGYTSVDPKYANWTMDDHIAYDVPALVWLVKRKTGAAEVTWVGHSMGGIVALAHLSRFQNPGIGRLVTVGSQLTMPEGQVIGQFLREMIQTRQQQLTGALRGEELVAHTRTSVYNLFFNEQNVSQTVYAALTTYATDVPAIGLMKQYMTLSERGTLLDASGRFNYAQGLGNIKVPVLFACGAGDQFAPPKVQKYLYDHVGSTDKALVVIGRAGGYAVDAGHNDAIVGLNSRSQFYPALAKWLAAPH